MDKTKSLNFINYPRNPHYNIVKKLLTPRFAVVMPQNFAVIFKTHFWDAFVERQFLRLRSRIRNGALYILIDETIETAGHVPYEPVIRIQPEDFARYGLAEVTTHGSVVWYNIDYPNYVAFCKIPAYDYYISVEYDAVICGSADALIAAAAAQRIDYLGLPIKKPASAWPWYDLHLDIYGPEMRVFLSCISVFSHRAMQHLLRRRREMAEDFQAGTLKFWPNNEAFIPNEIENAGLSLASLARFGDVSRYDWWPPLAEPELPRIGGDAFIHPVLAGQRYAKSMLHHEPSFSALLFPNSHVRSKLRQLGLTPNQKLLSAEIRRRLHARVNRVLEKFGFRQAWFANALHGVASGKQVKSPHNSLD